jgi:membrane protein
MTGSGLVQQVAAGFAEARRRLGWLDHLVRAVIRYDQADGGRLAAAVTYYAFFAAFSLVLVGFAILGYVLDNPAVLRSVQGLLSQNLPRLDAQALRDARGTTGLVALVVLLVAGLFWIDALRSSIRAIWQLEEYPGNFFLRQLIDLAVLAGLGLVLATSLAAAVSTETLLSWLLIDTAGADGPPGRWLLAFAGFALGIGFNTLLSIAVLTGLPRLRMRLRRVLGPALLVAAGLEILNTLGRLYVQRTEANPAYRVVAVAVGALVFLNLLNQLILFASALTATSTLGRVTDLAAARTPSAPLPMLPAGADGRPCLTWRRLPRRRKARSTGGAHPPRRWR